MYRILKKRKRGASQSLEAAEPSRKRSLIVKLPLPKALKYALLVDSLKRQVADLEKKKQTLSIAVAQLEQGHRTGTSMLQNEITNLRVENKSLLQKITLLEKNKTDMTRREADSEAIIAHLKSELKKERARSEMSEEALRRHRKQAANINQLRLEVGPERNKSERDRETSKREMLQKFKEFLDAQT